MKSYKNATLALLMAGLGISSQVFGNIDETNASGSIGTKAMGYGEPTFWVYFSPYDGGPRYDYYYGNPGDINSANIPGNFGTYDGYVDHGSIWQVDDDQPYDAYSSQCGFNWSFSWWGTPIPQ